MSPFSRNVVSSSWALASYALSHQSQRPCGVVDEFGGAPHALVVEFGESHIASHRLHVPVLIFHHSHLCVPGEVEHHGSRPSASCYVERAAHRPCYVVGVPYLVAPFRNGLAGTHQVHLLEGIGAKDGGAHLSGNDHDGCGVHHCVGNACQRVGGTRSAGNNAHAHLATHAGIALGGVCGGLFMAHQDMVKRFLFTAGVVVEGVIHRHDASAGIAENGFHALGLQRSHERLGACYLFLHSLNIILFGRQSYE